jgi:hypothetical protein
MSNRKRTPQGRGVAEPFPIPAPLLGLNSRDDFTLLKPTEARILENWLPDEGSCRVRPGYTEHQEISGETSVPSLMVWEGATGRKLVAASGGEIYDVTGSPSALTAGANYTDDLWSTANFNGWLFGVNGTSTPWRYDGGVATAATGFTGPTLTTLQTVSQVRNRLWFSRTGTADFSYGGIGAVTGALTAFQISQIASGGRGMDVGAWSRDAGDGSDDFTVFIMSTGQIIVYQGDPATNFALVGKYSAPAPVGPDCTIQIGGELIVMTVSGPIPVSAVVAGNAFQPEALGMWGKITGSWATDFKRYGSNAGWNAYFFNGLVYFVIPTGLNNNKVYVLNTRNSAPTVYTGMPIAMFGDVSGNLYFGSCSDNGIWRHATGTDNGAEISTLARQGWSYPTSGKRSAQFTMMRPHISASAACQAQFQVDVDFTDGEITAPVVNLVAEAEGAEWDVAAWDEEDWASDPVSHRFWHSIRGKGRAVAPVVRTYSTADLVEWSATDILAKAGGVL